MIITIVKWVKLYLLLNYKKVITSVYLNTEYYINIVFLIPLLLVFLLSLFVLFLIIKIIIFCSDAQDQANRLPSPYINPDRHDRRPLCPHDWKANYERVKCGWHMGRYEQPCQVTSDVTWKCSVCQEIRCGTHAQAHYPDNKGPSRNT